MKVTLVYSQKAEVRTSLERMRKVLSDNEVAIINSLLTLKSRAAETEIDGVVYRIAA